MQGDEAEFEYTPGLLETPSMMTPNIVLHASMKSVFNTALANIPNPRDTMSTSNSSPVLTTSSETQSPISTADVKVSKIEDELKLSFSEPRKPTPSPFQKMSSTNVFNLDKPPTIITNDDGTTIEIPSTADVVKELEALTNTNPLQFQVKLLNNNDNHEREITATMNGDNIRYDSPPTLNMGIVSPKKKFLIRSQSHTEPMSPIIINNNLSQSQKPNNDNSILNLQNGLDDENSIDDPIGNNIPALTKANTIVMPQAPVNEVTSTDQLSTAKRQRTAPEQMNPTVMNFRSTFPTSAVSAAATNTLTSTTTTNGSNGNGGSDDQRKKQIRDSNREAARRCRERRRQYIEQLEGNLEQHKAQIKQLNDKLARVERENTQLRAILSETKLLHPASRISANESHVEYANVVNATGMNINSESNHQIDGRTIQRSYIDRNNL
ncbi:unnamed protein product [Rotaria sp. Silwood2]|nr:unnamed protein product [Rotaria sp. Silwood2]